ncbi:MAG: host attachment protein [Chromatiales bacterium 21-64-14]|nr:MAG: host attachment protein [Chromatiales bacterium 21-64-14]HQU17277.1 host attachment protein [Gammaproteobacteria bacterium]
MNEYCVVVTDGARARFFTLEPAEFPQMQSGPNLVEQKDLVNPEGEIPDAQLWADTKSGRNRAPGGGPAHGYDDHREQHHDEFERRFARSVAHEAIRMTHGRNAPVVVLAAQKRMLGFLRAALAPLLKTGIGLRELAKDLSKHAPLDVHAHLAKECLIPARRGPSA